jgi:hypothetical protein
MPLQIKIKFGENGMICYQRLDDTRHGRYFYRLLIAAFQ